MDDIRKLSHLILQGAKQRHAGNEVTLKELLRDQLTAEQFLEIDGCAEYDFMVWVSVGLYPNFESIEWVDPDIEEPRYRVRDPRTIDIGAAREEETTTDFVFTLDVAA